MPSVSKAQQRLMAAAEHGATFPTARKLRQSMTHEQLHDDALGSMAHKPAHVSAPTPKAAPKYETEVHTYDWRQRHGLKRGR